MLCYFKITNTPATLPSTVPSLMGKDMEKANEGVKRSMEVKYNDYSATERARISQYAAEMARHVQFVTSQRFLTRWCPKK